MTQYQLDEPFLGQFRAALQQDNHESMLQSLRDASNQNKWPDRYWNAVRVPVCGGKQAASDSQCQSRTSDLVGAVAEAGNAKCFLAVLRFLLVNEGWSALSDMEREGRLSRSVVDVCTYLKARLDVLIGQGRLDIGQVQAMRVDLTQIYDVFFQASDGDKHFDALFERMNDVAREVVRLAGSKRAANAERDDLSKEFNSANSQAMTAARSRRI